jgi:hypothetical protein
MVVETAHVSYTVETVVLAPERLHHRIGAQGRSYEAHPEEQTRKGTETVYYGMPYLQDIIACLTVFHFLSRPTKIELF